MKLIDPSPERAAECEQGVLYAVAAVAVSQGRINKLPSPAEMRDILKERNKTLRILEKDSLLSQSYRDQTRRERERLEKMANHVPHGSRQLDSAKASAVLFAWHLLADFGRGPPGLTRKGLWHGLALALLMDNADIKTDLYEYMEYYGQQSKIPAPELQVPKRIFGMLVRED